MITEGLKFAAVDIGSNAIRLLFSRVLDEREQAVYIKESLMRMPLRLGDDAFAFGKISADKRTRLIHTMIAFNEMIKAYSPLTHRSCATSAFRAAENGPEIVAEINAKTALNLEIISEKEEAHLIVINQIERNLDPQKNYIYIDVGGGSTEVIFIKNNKRSSSKSFPIGSVRLLEDKVKAGDWDHMQTWIREKRAKYNGPAQAIGSGGNINKIYSMLNTPKDHFITYKEISTLLESIQPYTFHDRLSKLGLRPDRADVIIPAGKIYLTAMKCARVQDMIVPMAGLADGIIHELYAQYKKSTR